MDLGCGKLISGYVGPGQKPGRPMFFLAGLAGAVAATDLSPSHSYPCHLQGKSICSRTHLQQGVQIQTLCLDTSGIFWLVPRASCGHGCHSGGLPCSVGCLQAHWHLSSPIYSSLLVEEQHPAAT